MNRIITIESLLDNVPDINDCIEKKASREECGLLTKRIKTTNYAAGQICRLSREYDNNTAIMLFIKQGRRIEKMRQNEENEEKPERKPFWQEYFGL